MRRIALIGAILLLPLVLSACGNNSASASEDEAKVKEAVAFLSATEGGPAIFVKGRDVVLSYASRPPTFADAARKAALDASKATGGKAIKVYVVDSAEPVTAVPTAGQFSARSVPTTAAWPATTAKALWRN